MQHLRFGEHVVFGHTGSMPGFVAIVMTSAEHGITAAVQANAWSSLSLGGTLDDLMAIVREKEPTMPGVGAGHVGRSAGLRARRRLVLGGGGHRDDPARGRSPHLAGVGQRGRAARFARQADGRWPGLDGYYLGEHLEVCRDASGAITHLDLGSFVFTREPYGPADVVPDGLDLGGWQV